MGIYEDRGNTIEQAKENCQIELDVWYGGRVLDVFDCDVLGAPYRYYCAEADQLRMLNSKVANVSGPLMCGLIPAEPDTDPVYAWREHTSTESGKVHSAYVQFSKATALQYGTYKQRIASATTLTELNVLFNEIVYGVA